jgi:hypothetical protein
MNLFILVCGGGPRRRRRYLFDVTIRLPSLFLLSIRLVHRTLIVHFQRQFPSPFCFLVVYENLESLLMTFIFLASSSSCFLFSFTFSKKSLTSFCTVPSVSSSVFASGFFFAGRFHFFFGGCTDLKHCARELVANGC